jgi:CPA2 family monovalent cation:H+ antiporter-2
VEAATAAIVAGALAQIGEFSFLLVKFAIDSDVLPAEASAPILAAAFGAILLTPLSQRGFAWLAGWLARAPGWHGWQAARQGPPIAPPPGSPQGTPMAGHAILIGHGRVGRVVAEALRRHGLPIVVLEADRLAAERAMAAGIPTIWGDAARPEVLAAARPGAARLVVLALPDAAEAQRVLALVRAANPGILAAARAHDDADMALLTGPTGVGLAVMGEREIALGIADYAMQRLGVDAAAAQRTVDGLRAGMLTGG